MRRCAWDGHIVWKVKESGEGGCYASAAVVGNAVVFASRSRRILCADAATGRTRWSFRTKGDVDSSPVVAGGTVFAGSGVGVLYALRLADGKKVWQLAAGGAIKFRRQSPAAACDRQRRRRPLLRSRWAVGEPGEERKPGRRTWWWIARAVERRR